MRVTEGRIKQTCTRDASAAIPRHALAITDCVFHALGFPPFSLILGDCLEKVNGGAPKWHQLINNALLPLCNAFGLLSHIYNVMLRQLTTTTDSVKLLAFGVHD